MTAFDEERSRTASLSWEIDSAYENYLSGKQDAEQMLYQALRTQAENVVWCRLAAPNKSLAHDIATKAMMALKSFKDGSRLSTWFYTVAQNMVNDALTALITDRERLVPIEAMDGAAEEERTPQSEGVPAPSFEDQINASIDVERLARDLPPEQGEVLRLNQEGHSLEEIAGKTGIPLGTIRGRHRLAKEKIKKNSSSE